MMSSFVRLNLVPKIIASKETLASFRFEDDDEIEDQVQLLLILRMLKSVTVMA